MRVRNGTHWLHSWCWCALLPRLLADLASCARRTFKDIQAIECVARPGFVNGWVGKLIGAVHVCVVANAEDLRVSKLDGRALC